MRVSIIIPVYNEEKTIRKLLRTLEPVKEKAEILFVDGGSTDRTLSLLPEEYKVVKGPKGRAWQMNLGAEKSRGNVLFFLHCDSELPKDAIEQIERVMRKYQVGCFGIAFHSKNIWMKCCQIISNHRIKDRYLSGESCFLRWEASRSYRLWRITSFPLRLRRWGLKLELQRRESILRTEDLKKGEGLR